MGNHRVASNGARAGLASTTRATQAASLRLPGPKVAGSKVPSLRNWPVSWRLIAVIVLALGMGLVFGGLRVADAVGSASQFGRVVQLADLGQQVTGLVQALENERDETSGILPVTTSKEAQPLQPWYNATNAAAAQVRTLAAGIGGSFPANIQSRVASVVADINNLGELRKSNRSSQSALALIEAYATPISDMIALNDQIAQGTSDAVLANDVQTLNSLSQAKDEAAQQRALLYNSLANGIFADGEQQELTTAQSEELTDLTAFDTTATPAQQSTYASTVAGPRVNTAEAIEIYVQSADSLALSGPQTPNISPTDAPGAWYRAQSAKVDDMQQVELDVARNIVARAQSLQSSAGGTALVLAIVTAAVLLLVLLATVVVARSLVGPLRRLREGALNIATVELPERVRLLGETEDPSASLEVQPIDVLSTDEVGQVARAFDQVHSEAVRLAGNEAMLRNSFNAMFVNLSRRSQSLIERLARMIDSLEQNEGDPERLSNLFSMDHLVTRMRRNSENLLLLAGHEGARKWSEPVSLADVARAATSEIEQYSRVTLKVQPGVAVTGPAVSDVVHLLAEVIENATIFSAKDTPVHVSAQELTSGGVLIEVTDSGVGIPEARLAEMNWRLDNPPVMDVSVSRHMGLFAVARLAERHGVRVRLRPRSPHGLTALVWLPDSVTERAPRLYSSRSRLVASPGGFQVGPATGGTGGMHVVPDIQSASDRIDATMPIPSQSGTAPRATVPTFGAGLPTAATSGPAPFSGTISTPAASSPAFSPAASSAATNGPATNGGATSDWFRSRRSSAPDAAGNGESPAVGGGRFETEGWAVGRHAAQIIAEPVRGESTAAGLPVRVPQANLIPGSVGGGRQVGKGAPGRPAPGHDTPTTTAPRSRSPEVARTRLSGFQRGVRRAKGDKPRADQGADS
jgi:signal transduction histidine kinase